MRRQTVLLCALLAAATASDALYAATRSPMPAETAVSDVPIEENAPATPTNHPPRFIFDAPITEQPRAAAEIPAEPPIAVQPPKPEQSAEEPAEQEAPTSEPAPITDEPSPATDEPAPQEPASSAAPAEAPPDAADTALQRLAAVEAALAQRVDLLAQELLQKAGGDSDRLAALAKDAAAQFDAIESAADREAEAVFAALDAPAAEKARGDFAAAKAAQLGYWRTLIADDAKKADKNADDFQISP